MILYEGVDLAYNVARIGYNSVAGIYNWYYEIETEEEKEHKEAKEMIDELKKLNERVKELEEVLMETKKISNNKID